MSKKFPLNPFPMQFPPEQAVSFDLEAFDTAIVSQGVTLVHYRAMACPIGMIDPHDVRKPHEDHGGCSNGFLYTQAGCVTALFTGNSHQNQQADPGIMQNANVYVTFPRFYDPCGEGDASQKPVEIAVFDRVYLKEEAITVQYWERFESHVTGKNRLSFPICCVLDLVDSTGRRYGSGDFTVEAGQLVFAKPPFDAESGKGLVCSIRYSYRPFWYIMQFQHEVRVTQRENPFTGERQVFKMPQAVLLQREFVFHNEQKDDQAPNPSSARQVLGPRDGTFGPR